MRIDVQQSEYTDALAPCSSSIYKRKLARVIAVLEFFWDK